MQPGVAHHEIQASPGPLRKRSLKPVIIRPVAVLKEIDESQKREPVIERAAILLAMIAGNLFRRIRIHLVDVADVVELRAVIPDIAQLQRSVCPESLLDVQAP